MADISLLKTFIELSKTRHFGKTAKALFLTQSAVSARIRLLEETVGVKLLTRDRNNIQLTPAGLRLLPFAESMINTWNRARQEAALKEESMSLLTIGGMTSLWETDLQDFVVQHRENYPDVALQVGAYSPQTMLQLMLDGGLDLAFSFESPQLSDLHVEPIGNLSLTMLSSYPEQTAEQVMLRQDYVMVDWGSAFSAEHARSFPNQPPAMVRMSHGHLALGFLKKNGGTAYLAESMAHTEVEQGFLFEVQGAPVIERAFYAVYSQSSVRLELIQQALNLLRQQSDNN